LKSFLLGEIRVARVLSWLVWIFVALYVLAIANFAGLMLGIVPFGSPLTSLLGWLGFPWVSFADRLPQMAMLGLGLSFWAALLAPVINLLILFVLARLFRARGW